MIKEMVFDQSNKSNKMLKWIVEKNNERNSFWSIQ